MENKMFKDLICERVDLCDKGENSYLIHEFENSYFVIGDHQFYKGYSLLLFKRHVRELHELSKEEYMGLSEELYIANAAIYKTFKPWKMNNQSLGNKDEHVHWHIMPRYEDDKYHNTLPLTDYMKGEVDLSKFIISLDEAKRLASEVRKNIDL